MTLFMLDTNICSFLMRHHPQVGLNLMQQVSLGAVLAITAITYS